MKPGEVGMTVRIPIPDVDRSRRDHRNVLGILMYMKDVELNRRWNNGFSEINLKLVNIIFYHLAIEIHLQLQMS